MPIEANEIGPEEAGGGLPVTCEETPPAVPQRTNIRRQYSKRPSRPHGGGWTTTTIPLIHAVDPIRTLQFFGEPTPRSPCPLVTSTDERKPRGGLSHRLGGTGDPLEEH